MPDFTVSPVTQNHQTAVGKAFSLGRRSTSVGVGGGECRRRRPFEESEWSLNSFLWNGKTNANISYLGLGLILWLANMSDGLRVTHERA